MALLAELPWAVAALGRAGGGRAAGPLVVWQLWDRFLLWRWQLAWVRPGGILRYRVITRAGHPFVDLHIDNRRLLEITDSGARPFDAVRTLFADIDALMERARRGDFGNARAAGGITLFAAHGEPRGYHSTPLPRTWRSALVHYYLVGLIAVYHPRGWSGAQRYRRRWPRELRLELPRAAPRRVTTTPRDRDDG